MLFFLEKYLKCLQNLQSNEYLQEVLMQQRINLQSSVSVLVFHQNAKLNSSNSWTVFACRKKTLKPPEGFALYRLNNSFDVKYFFVSKSVVNWKCFWKRVRNFCIDKKCSLNFNRHLHNVNKSYFQKEILFFEEVMCEKNISFCIHEKFMKTFLIWSVPHT